MTTEQRRRYHKIVITLANIRADIKHYLITGTLPEYVNNIYDAKELESKYAKSAYNLRNGI